ncbi:MAG: efflux RND transporter periplasmic adaptor subunit [Planctomycetaceae bacterium]
MHGTQSQTSNSQAELSTPALTSLRFLRHRLEDAANRSADRETFLGRVAQLLSSTIGQDCIVWLEVDGQNLRLTGLNVPAEGLSEDLQKALSERGAEAIRTLITHVSVLKETETINCICAPVRTIASTGALVILHSGRQQTLPFAVAAAELVAAVISGADNRREATRAFSEANDAGAVVDILARTELAADRDTCLQRLCEELKQHFQCHEVVVGLKPSDDSLVEFTASSDNKQIDDDLRLAYNAALHESLMQACPAAFPPPPGAPRHALLAHRQLAGDCEFESIVSCPLRTEDGVPHGSLLLLQPGPQVDQQRTLKLLEAAEPRIAATVSLIERSDRKGVELLASKLRAIAQGKTGRAVLLGIVGAALLLCVPLPYSVKATCELQPLNHRYVAAPFEAPLEQCFVEPGDIVKANELLARIDGREIRMSLAEIASDRNRAAKERDMHRAKREYGAAEMSRLQMEAHQARAELLEYRGQNLEIRSPSSGVVVSGDWKKSEGIPLRTGETMFEIAPLNRMIVEVGIPEDDITHIEVGQTVTVRMDAYANKSWTGKLLRVHPAAEVRDGEHVFIGQLELDNPELRLRPGMRGKAKISTAARPLGWNLFHKPWNAMIAWLRYAI